MPADPKSSPDIQPVAEFQALPLEMIVAQPLLAAIRAQQIAADRLARAIQDAAQQQVTMSVQLAGSGAPQQITVPRLALLPPMRLRVDSVTAHFRYEVTQTVRSSKQTDLGLDGSVGTGAALSAFAQATLKGTLAHKSATESSTNRSGILEISVSASDAPMPEGLARLISLLSRLSVPDQPPQT